MEPAGLTSRAERFRNVTDEYFSDVSLSFPFCGYLVFMQQRFDDPADTSIVVNMGAPDIREDPALPVSAAAGSKTPMRQPRAPPGMAFHYTVCVSQKNWQRAGNNQTVVFTLVSLFYFYA